MDVDFLFVDEFMDLVRAPPATHHDFDVVRYHLAVLVSMPSEYSRLAEIEGVPELVEMLIRVDSRTYGIYFGFTTSGTGLRAYGFWRDPAFGPHGREAALETAQLRYWKDHAHE